MAGSVIAGSVMAGSVAVVILTRNEAIHLERALRSVMPFAASMHVIDCGSTDDTLAIAARLGAEILTHPWRNHADQFEWALRHISTEAQWIMRLDADEIVEADLAGHIARQLPLLAADVAGITLDRKHIFMGRRIRHGGRGALRMVRIFRRGKAHVERRWMDEHIVADGGRTVHFPGGFADWNLTDLSAFTAKHNRYATCEAIDVIARRRSLWPVGAALSPETASWQAAIKRRMKEQVFYRLPFPLSATGYFLFRYIIQLGFLDGREGLIYHFLQGYWYRFLVGARVTELERAIAHLSEKHDVRRERARLTGLDLDGPLADAGDHQPRATVAA